MPLKSLLPGHDVSTVFEMGWSDLDNGVLLAKAETSFDALVTTDQNLRHQQVLSSRRLGILVLMTTSWPRIRKHASRVAEALDTFQAGAYIELVFED